MVSLSHLLSGPAANVIYQSLSSSKTVVKKPATSAGQLEVQVNGTEQKV